MNYTSKHLENRASLDPDMSTAERILLRLKTRGPASTATLAQELGMTAEAARLQVQKLLAEELISGVQEAAAGAGRPRQNWELSPAGHTRFPDTHAYLTIQLIGSIRQLFGEEGLDRLISQREGEMRKDYLKACSGVAGIPKKLDKLAALRAAEGYMARVEKDGKDWLLIEDHCPICAAATTCQGFCRSELQLFREVIGDAASVTREEHLLAGARRCVYRVSHA